MVLKRVAVNRGYNRLTSTPMEKIFRHTDGPQYIGDQGNSAPYSVLPRFYLAWRHGTYPTLN